MINSELHHEIDGPPHSSDPSRFKQDNRYPSDDYHAVVSMYSSQAVTWENVIAALRKKAGEAYARGRDEEAKILRDLADEWKTMPAEARKLQHDYEAEYRPAVDE